jgi:hypothetical protein
MLRESVREPLRPRETRTRSSLSCTKLSLEEETGKRAQIMLGTMNLAKKEKHIPRHVDNRRRVDCSDRSIRVRASDSTRTATFLSEEQKGRHNTHTDTTTHTSKHSLRHTQNYTPWCG